MKITLSLTKEQHEQLVNLAAKRKTTLAQMVVRGIGLQKFLLEHDDAKIYMKDGRRLSEVVLMESWR